MRRMILYLLTGLVLMDSGAMLNSQRPASGGRPSPGSAITAPEHRVDINHASLQELMKVPGMTRSWAARIVRYRPYRTKLDLLDGGIVSSEVYQRIKDYVIAHREKQ